MGQKVNPHGLRVGVIKDWDSRWYVNKQQFGDTLVEDYNIRKYLKAQLYTAGVSKIEIERDSKVIRINVFCGRPGMVIGPKGANIEKTRTAVSKLIKRDRDEIIINVTELKRADADAQLIAEKIAADLEGRVAFRRAMKSAMSRATRMGVKGIKTSVSGRLGGADIARTEHYHEGTIPLQTLRADIDYGFAEANTTYGKVGVKVWVYKGEVLKSAKPRREGGRR